MNLISKSELMLPVFRGEAHECFEHSELGIFDVTMTRAWAENNAEVMVVDLSDIVPFILTNRVTEPSRVMQLSEASWRSDPGLILYTEEPNGSHEHVVIDGHHRALRRNAEGETTMGFYVLPLNRAVRPSYGWTKQSNVDWGDEIIDGKIVKRVQ
jgi:hypothetical protein